MQFVKGWEGRFYEDFEPGSIYQHQLGRTITSADNAWFTLLTMNTHPMHFDDEYASRTPFGQPLVVSTLTLAIVVGLSVADVSQNAMANLGWESVRMPKPVFVGDTLYAESLVLDKRDSESRPTVGIVRVKTRGLNQRGEVVLEYTRAVMVYKRHDSQVRTSFPVTSPPFTSFELED